MYMYQPFDHVSRDTAEGFCRDAADDCWLLVVVCLLDCFDTRSLEEDPTEESGDVTSVDLSSHNPF
jgi:hypothetical protein